MPSTGPKAAGRTRQRAPSPVQAAEPAEPLLTLSGVTSMNEFATALVDSAEEELPISCWEPEAEALHRSLAAAHERGVRVFGLLYGPSRRPACRCATTTRRSSRSACRDACSRLS